MNTTHNNRPLPTSQRVPQNSGSAYTYAPLGQAQHPKPGERYATSVINPYEQQAEDVDAIAHEPLFESELNRTSALDRIKENAHNIAFAAGNLLLIVGEYRVFDFTWANTGETWKAWFAVLASFIPFLLWEIAVQHAKANDVMRFIAWTGMVLSFALGATVGIADFMTINGQSPNAEVLLGILAGSLSIHAVLFLGYFYSHPDIKAKRLVAQAVAKQELANSSAEVAENLLNAARNRLELERRIASEYGYENLRRAIAEIEGRPYSRPKKIYASQRNRQQANHAQSPVVPGMPQDFATEPYQPEEPVSDSLFSKVVDNRKEEIASTHNGIPEGNPDTTEDFTARILGKQPVNDEVRSWVRNIEPDVLRDAGNGDEQAITAIAQAFLENRPNSAVGKDFGGNGNGAKPSAPANFH